MKASFTRQKEGKFQGDQAATHDDRYGARPDDGLGPTQPEALRIEQEPQAGIYDAEGVHGESETTQEQAVQQRLELWRLERPDGCRGQTLGRIRVHNY